MKNIKVFDGQHCETTATGTLLLQLDINLSEPMLFGLGQGLGFIYWNMKTMALPFIGGRIKPDLLTINIATNLKLNLNVYETSSQKKAWEEVKLCIDSGQVVGIKLDCYYLTYFSRAFHFAGHYVAIYDYDQQDAYLVDTHQQGGRVKTSLESLALARAEKGPMASKNLFYTLQKTVENYDLKQAILNAIKNNASDFIHPPIANFGYKGILKTSNEILHWFDKSKDLENDFKNIAILMEKAGTGGALFRNLYRDFLKESYDLLQLVELKEAHESYITIADHWTSVSKLFEKVSETKNYDHLIQASQILKVIAEKEKSAMELLKSI